MKQTLLLLEDVDGLGRSGDIASVKAGYARNYLLPQKKAVIAKPHTVRMQERLQEERAKKAVVDKTEAEALASRLQGMTLTTEVKIDPEGNMYGSVGGADIVELFAKEGFILEKKYILLPRPIKELGTYPINLRLKEGVPAEITLTILGEGGVKAKVKEVLQEEKKEEEEEKEIQDLADEGKSGE